MRAESAGQVIRTPLVGAGKPNPFCGPMKPLEAIPEDTQSVTTYFTFGRFRALHPGDLTRDKERDLMCPANRVGTIDVLVGPHHGQDTSNDEAFVHALQPRVVVLNNGTRKGGWPDVTEILLHLSSIRGFVADAFFIAERSGVRIARSVHRQRRRRAAERAACCSVAGARRERAASTRSQWSCVLGESVRARRRHVHRHQRAKRILEEISVGSPVPNTSAARAHTR